MRRRDWRIEQIRDIEREFQVMKVAADMLRSQLQRDPSYLTAHGLRERDFTHADANLTATYLIRLFAEFETGLREAWSVCYRKRSHPQTGKLLESLAARCSIAPEWHQAADNVRRLRNLLVHEGDEQVEAISVDIARGHLCRFFSRLPPNW